MAEGYMGPERRKSPRVDCDLRAKIFNRGIRSLTPVLNLSYEGALIKTHRLIRPEDNIDLEIYFPIMAGAINANARVARVEASCPPFGISTFDTGIEFLNLGDAQKEILAQTVDFLRRQF